MGWRWYQSNEIRKKKKQEMVTKEQGNGSLFWCGSRDRRHEVEKAHAVTVAVVLLSLRASRLPS